jgi:hypothetical protein
LAIKANAEKKGRSASHPARLEAAESPITALIEPAAQQQQQQ